MKKLTRKQRFDQERHRQRREHEAKIMARIAGEHPWTPEDAYRMMQALEKSNKELASGGVLVNELRRRN